MSNEEEEDEIMDIAYVLTEENGTEFEQTLLYKTASPFILKNGHNFSNSFKNFQ